MEERKKISMQEWLEMHDRGETFFQKLSEDEKQRIRLVIDKIRPKLLKRHNKLLEETLQPALKKSKEIDDYMLTINGDIEKYKHLKVLLDERLALLDEYDKRVEKEIYGLIREAIEGDPQLKLFANAPQEMAFQLSMVVSHNFNKSRDLLGQGDINDILKRRITKIDQGENGPGIEFIIDYNQNSVTNLQKEFERQFYELMRSIKNPKHKLYYAAMWRFASNKGVRFFRGTKVNDIIRIATHKGPNEKVTHRERKEFTDFIDNYSRIRIKVFTGNREKKVRRGKQMVTELEKDFKYIYLFHLTEGTEKYLVDQKQRIIEGRTISRIYGELPEDPFNVGHYIPNSIFNFDGNEGRRIEFVFELWREANRKNPSHKDGEIWKVPDFNKKPLKFARIDLIEAAGLSKTNQSNKWEANESLKETLERLKELKIIAAYSPDLLPIEDDELIEIHLPDIRDNSRESEQPI